MCGPLERAQPTITQEEMHVCVAALKVIVTKGTKCDVGLVFSPGS